MIWITFVVFSVILIGYELAFHKDYRLKLACFGSGLLYLFCAYFDAQMSEYDDGYIPFIIIDAVWLLLLVHVVAPRLTVACVLTSIGWTMACLAWPNHWFFYEWHYAIFFTLHITLVASLTILPTLFPRRLGLPYSEKDDGSFFRLFSIAVVKDSVRLFLRSRV